ncbi:hypothetical protein GCM10022221_32230 [Actinocorallia aurea]
MFDSFACSAVAAPVLATWPPADRLRPGFAAHVFAWCAVAAAACALVNVLAFVLKAPAGLSAVAAWGGRPAEAAHVPWATGLSVVWFAVSVVGVLLGWRRYRASLRGTSQDVAHPDSEHGEDDVVVVPDDRVEAFALPGRPVAEVAHLVERAADEEAALAAFGRPVGLVAMGSGVVPRRMAAVAGREVRRRWALAVPVLLAASTVV